MVYAKHAWYDPLSNVPATVPFVIFIQGWLIKGTSRTASQSNSSVNFLIMQSPSYSSSYLKGISSIFKLLVGFSPSSQYISLSQSYLCLNTPVIKC